MPLRHSSMPSLIAVAAGLALLASASIAKADDPRDFWSLNAGIAYAWNEHAFRDFDGNDVASIATGTWGWGPDAFPDWLGVELEGGLTLTDGRWLGEDWSMQTVAGYLSGHWGSERLYLKLRGGIASNRVEIADFSGNDTGLAGGVGLGFKLLGQPLEAHFTAVDGNVNTITLHWRF